MNRTGYIFAICLICFSMTVSAQTYEQVKRRNIWSISKNINGLRQDATSRSYAEVEAGYEAGAFRDTWMPECSWNAGVSTASIRHLDRMTLAGSFSFIQSEGYDMCGSMFVKPGYFPVDVLEFTPGRKTLQTYAFDGGLSYDLTSQLRLGAMMDFESSNIAKRKDLRHSNYRLEMMVSPGISYHRNDLVLGANLIAGKTTEAIQAKQIGTKEASYYAFLDKGLMFGEYAVWSGSGLHLNESGVGGFPVVQTSFGGALQVQQKGLFIEAEYLRTYGKVGEKEFVWYQFPGNEFSLKAGYTHKSSNAAHYARMEYTWNNLDLQEAVIEKVTEGGVINIYNHGSNRVLSQSGWTLCPEYEYASSVFDLIANVVLEEKYSTSSQIYPHVDVQTLFTWSAGLETTLYLDALGATVDGFEVSASLRYHDGSVSEHGYMVSEQTGSMKEPYRLQDWYDRHMEYVTSSALKLDIGVRYAFWKGLYCSLECGWMKAFDVKHIAGSDRVGAKLTFGYDF